MSLLNWFITLQLSYRRKIGEISAAIKVADAAERFDNAAVGSQFLPESADRDRESVIGAVEVASPQFCAQKISGADFAGMHGEKTQEGDLL